MRHTQCLLQVDSIIMAGNHISRLPTDLLMYMSHIKKVDLRMNKLQLLPTETAKFHSLEHVTHIDIRDNQVSRRVQHWKRSLAGFVVVLTAKYHQRLAV